MDQPTFQPYRQRRLAAGLSIRQLEALTGINRGRLSNIERGLPPSPDEARKITDALAGREQPW